MGLSSQSQIAQGVDFFQQTSASVNLSKKPDS